MNHPAPEALTGLLPDLEVWIGERLENCEWIAKRKTGADRDGWLEDAEHFRRVLADLRELRHLRQQRGTPGEEDGERDARQRRVAEWCAAAFGAEHQASVTQRGLRMLEEAIEAYQACGCGEEQAHKLVSYVFARPAGNLAQELGGVGLTVLALAAASGLSADNTERSELERVLSKPLAWFAARNKVKNDAGFDATAYPAAIRGAKGG